MRGSRIFLSRVGGGATARIQDPHKGPTHTHMYRLAHECSGTGRRIDKSRYMYRRQTKRHIKTDLIETCISMYRDVINIHARACRGIHARVIIFKFPMKMK